MNFSWLLSFGIATLGHRVINRVNLVYTKNVFHDAVHVYIPVSNIGKLIYINSQFFHKPMILSSFLCIAQIFKYPHLSTISSVPFLFCT